MVALKNFRLASACAPPLTLPLDGHGRGRFNLTWLSGIEQGRPRVMLRVLYIDRMKRPISAAALVKRTATTKTYRSRMTHPYQVRARISSSMGV